MNKPALATDRSNHSLLALHAGEALHRVASAYPTVLDVILEQVQNAIDADAKHIRVVLNRKTKHIAIRDDGDGVTEEMFEQALKSVCMSSKEAGKLGRFGIGLISPLGKCHHSTFTSCHKNSEVYHEWTFYSESIRKQRENVGVPHLIRPELTFARSTNQSAPKGKTGVMWRTEVNIHDYSKDRVISRIGTIETLRDEILERFSGAMRKKGVALSLKFVNTNGSMEELTDIRAKEFTGRPLPQIVIYDRDAGNVTFTLYLASKTTKGQNGKVNVGEVDNDFRFSFDLLTRACSGLLSEEIVSGLTSGILEGEILGERIALHSTRRAFEQDEALAGFCTAIERWYAEHGVKYLEDAAKESRDKRYQDLGLASLRGLEELLKNPDFADLRSVLKGFKVGSADPGTDIEKGMIAGKQDEHSMLTGLHADNDSAGESEGSKGTPRSAQEEPYTVAGPRGRQRALVKRGNLGLQFSYVAMDGSDKLWELDVRQGVLHFNVNHPTWVEADVSDRKVMQLQETVALNALIVESMPGDWREIARLYCDDVLRPLVHLYRTSPAFNPHKRVLL